MRLLRQILVMFAIALCAAPTLAQGQPRTQKQRLDEAMPHFQKGVELYDENDFANAVIEFKRAYDIAQDYHVLFNVSQTYYQLQNYAGALDAFQRYLTEGGTNLARDRRAYVEKEIQKLKGRVAQVRVTVNVPGADILVDDEKVATSPMDHALVVSAGKRKITASVAGKSPASQTIEVAGGDTSTVTLQIESSQTPPPNNNNTNTITVTPGPVVETRRRVPWVAWGVAGGLFVVWAATGATALAFSGSATSKLNTYGASADDIKNAENTAGAVALVSDIALGCTLAALGVATVMTILAKPERIENEKDKNFSTHGISAHVIVSPFGAGVFGTF